jgi:hypothetical protein
VGRGAPIINEIIGKLTAPLACKPKRRKLQTKTMSNPLEADLDGQDEVDYDFMLGELERINTLSVEAQIQHYRANPMDSMYSLDVGEGRSLNLTVAGHNRFVQIVDRRLAASDFHRRRFSGESLVKELKKEYIARLRDNSIAATDPTTLFASAMIGVQTTHREITHLIPCAVVVHRKTQQFSIGPVVFHWRESFWKEAEPKIRERLPDSPDIAWAFLSRLRDFYGGYSWIAEVRVPPCDEEISSVRATRIAQKCLDLLKLRIGSARAARIHQAYGAAGPRDQSHLRKIDDLFHISVGGAKMHDAVLNDDWFTQISGDPMWKTAEAYIKAYCDGWDQSPNELQQRFIDGMSWHSDAVSEPDVTAQIIKYWTAIERVVSLKKDDRRFKTNAAILLSETAKEYEVAIERVTRLYRQRNAIVHGSAQRGDPDLARCASESEEVSQKILFNYSWLIRSAPSNIDPHRARAVMTGLFAQWEGVLTGRSAGITTLTRE